jgi:DNA repair exonuclease SbcCD ATPase subunit
MDRGVVWTSRQGCTVNGAWIGGGFWDAYDKRFRNTRISLPVNSPPELHFPDARDNRQLQSNSGFEKRAFGIAYTLALAEITRRRVPLVIDTPLGNADSEYRPRTLKALANFDLDQVIILTHDKEVEPDLVEHIRGQVSQKFLVEYNAAEGLSVVHPNRYFEA